MGTTHLDGLQVAGVPTMGVNPLPLANQYWFVSSVIGANSFTGDSYQTPFGTLAFASSATTNPKLAAGDCIVVMEGHTETVTAAGGITLNTVGLYVVGLGNGSYRPTFTFATPATTSWLISAAGVTVANIVGVSGVNTLTKPFDIQAASCTLGSGDYGWVEWQDPSSSLQAQRVVLTNASADKLIVNLKVIGQTSGGTAPVHAVQVIGVDSGIIRLDFYGRASTATINFTDTSSTNIEIYGYMYNASNTSSSFALDVIDTVGSSTWFASFSDGWVGYDLSGGSGSALGPAQAATVIADLAVPSANSTANSLERDVLGNKTDTGVTAVTTTASEMAYTKGIVTMNTVTAANNTANAFTTDVVGNKTDTGVQAVVTNASSIAYTKGILDQLSGTTGITTFPSASPAANAVSIAEVLRYVSELQVPRIAIKTITSASTTLTVGTATLFTVSGDIYARVWATVQTAVTTTSNTGSLAVGISGATTAILPTTIASGGAQFGTGTVWVDNVPTTNAKQFTAANLNYTPIANTTPNIICTVATNSCSAGAITFYCQYLPSSVGATVVAA